MEIRDLGYRGQKGQRIPDPDPQHCSILKPLLLAAVPHVYFSAAVRCVKHLLLKVWWLLPLFIYLVFQLRHTVRYLQFIDINLTLLQGLLRFMHR
jgi:hypothetical protein